MDTNDLFNKLHIATIEYGYSVNDIFIDIVSEEFKEKYKEIVDVYFQYSYEHLKGYNLYNQSQLNSSFQIKRGTNKLDIIIQNIFLNYRIIEAMAFNDYYFYRSGFDIQIKCDCDILKAMEVYKDICKTDVSLYLEEYIIEYIVHRDEEWSCQRRREKVASLVSKIGKRDGLNMEERCKLTYEVQRKVSHQQTKEGFIAIHKLTDEYYKSISEDCESRVNINIKLINENMALREKINQLENEISKLRIAK